LHSGETHHRESGHRIENAPLIEYQMSRSEGRGFLQAPEKHECAERIAPSILDSDFASSLRRISQVVRSTWVDTVRRIRCCQRYSATTAMDGQ
jgi:hypothetical protein